MCKRLFFLMCCCIPLLTYGQLNSNLFFRDVRSWGQWNGTVSTVDVKTNICGMFAYSEMTIEFKDTLAMYKSDSLELTCNFYLPPESVVDSMYLWIGNAPKVAYLLDIGRANQIYSSIVRVRRDPAFLRISGNLYTLRIFPFKSHETRKVKFNFSSPLVASDNQLTMRLPLDFIANSIYAPSKVNWEVSCASPTIFSDLKIIDSQGITITENTSGGQKVLVASAANIKFSSPLMCTVRNLSYTENGYVAEMTKNSKGETVFSTILNADKMLKVGEVNRKKVLFIWNEVYSSYYMNHTNSEPCNYDQSGDCHYYDDYDLVNSYTPPNPNDLDAFSKFISHNLHPGDSFDIVLNDGKLKRFSSGTLVNATTENCSRAASFILSAPSKAAESSNSKLNNLIDLLESTLVKSRLKDSMDIVIIDKTRLNLPSTTKDTSYTIISHYSYQDVNKTIYEHYSSKSVNIDFEALVKKYLAQIPASATVYALADLSQSYSNTRMYNQLTQATKGMIIPFNDREYGFGNLSELIMGKLYPANLTFTTKNNSYVYDLNGFSLSSTIALYKPLFITGKIFGTSGNIIVNLQGRFNGHNYSFNKEIPTITTSKLPSMQQIWASKKVAQLKMENSLIANNEATKISFNNHILTEYTALLALEPSMDTLLNSTEKQQNDRQTTAIKGNVEPASQKHQTPHCSVVMTKSSAIISIADFNHIQPGSFSLKIYDISGRLIADITKKALNANGKVILSNRILQRGTYIIRLSNSISTINKQFIITW